jgi:hypothetical protein
MPTTEELEQAMKSGAVVFGVHYSASAGAYIASAHGILGEHSRSVAATGPTMLDALHNAYAEFRRPV